MFNQKDREKWNCSKSLYSKLFTALYRHNEHPKLVRHRFVHSASTYISYLALGRQLLSILLGKYRHQCKLSGEKSIFKHCANLNTQVC